MTIEAAIRTMRIHSNAGAKRSPIKPEALNQARAVLRLAVRDGVYDGALRRVAAEDHWDQLYHRPDGRSWQEEVGKQAPKPSTDSPSAKSANDEKRSWRGGDNELIRRAIGTYLRAAALDGQLPSSSDSVVFMRSPHCFVVLRNGKRVLAVYRVSEKGTLVLTGMHEPPDTDTS
jgi:hypothetical protein